VPTTCRGGDAQVISPAKTDPVEFQSLALKLGRRDFKLIRGADITWRTEEPFDKRITAPKTGGNLDAIGA
jgi:hypothetical protein